MTIGLIVFPSDLPDQLRVAIFSETDGDPRGIGLALANICSVIVYGTSTPEVLSMSMGLKDSPLRVCKDEHLPAAVMGMLWAEWDRLEEFKLGGKGADDAIQLRHSHLQFQLLPEMGCLPQVFNSYRYAVMFKDYKGEVMGKLCRRRPWISISCNNEPVFEGWPESVAEFCSTGGVKGRSTKVH
ncbi:hypothetical protein ACYPKM_04595 [Pseudomonas aeruginosa]